MHQMRVEIIRRPINAKQGIYKIEDKNEFLYWNKY